MRFDHTPVLACAVYLTSILVCPSMGSPIAQRCNAGRHFLAACGTDSLFVLISTEDDSLRRIGRGVVFFSVHEGAQTVASEHWFDDSYTLDYLISDMDGDGLNELVVADKDEAMFSVTIFHPVRRLRSFILRPAFEKEGMWLPRNGSIGFTPPTLEIKDRPNGLHQLLVNFTNEDGAPGVLHVGFDNTSQRFKAFK